MSPRAATTKLTLSMSFIVLSAFGNVTDSIAGTEFGASVFNIIKGTSKNSSFPGVVDLESG